MKKLREVIKQLPDILIVVSFFAVAVLGGAWITSHFFSISELLNPSAPFSAKSCLMHVAGSLTLIVAIVFTMMVVGLEVWAACECFKQLCAIGKAMNLAVRVFFKEASRNLAKV